MLRDITLGQYYPADSVVHKLDPRVKLFATMIYIIALFTFRGILGFAIITGMLIFMIKISKVPFSYIVKGLKAIVVLLLITAVFNLVFTPTGTEYWHWGPFHLTSTGIMNAVLMTIRLIYLIIGTSLMTLTTTPNQLTDGLEKALSPLNLDSHTGACDCDDDVHCPAVYSDSHRGNGQDHEGTDGAWSKF